MDLYRHLTGLLRWLDAETAHRLSLRALALGLGPVRNPAPDPVLAQSLWRLQFPNPVGIAAGYDKNAEVPTAVLRAGCGFAEVGTVTPLPQPGNPRPRLFRLPRDQAVINRLGFNNDGLEAVGKRLARLPRRPGVVGVNLGANKASAEPIADYVTGIEALRDLAGYFVINVSSPNTPGLRALQGRQQLQELLAAVRQARGAATTPILVKIAPDLEDKDLGDIADASLAAPIDGAIISNTTIGLREGLHGPHAGEAGGLSGAPLFALATDRLRRFFQLSEGRLPLIGAGGIASGRDAYAKIRNGASLVQLYTALVYAGPGLIPRINRDLAALLKADGFRNIAEAVGVDARS